MQTVRQEAREDTTTTHPTFLLFFLHGYCKRSLLRDGMTEKQVCLHCGMCAMLYSQMQVNQLHVCENVQYMRATDPMSVSAFLLSGL